MTRSRDVASNGGLVLINTTTFSASSSVSFNNVFSSTYANYRLTLEVTAGSNATNILLRMRSNGTDNSSTDYRTGGVYVGMYGSTALASNNNGTDSGAVIAQINSTYGCNATVDIFKPFAVDYTKISSLGGGHVFLNFITGTLANTSYDGFTILPGAGTITGTIRVYGYKN